MSGPTSLAGDFAGRLRELRQRAGLTQEELATRAGLTPHAVSALERGTRTRPYPHTVRALAAALGLDDRERSAFLAAVPARGRRAAPAPVPSTSPGPSPSPSVSLSVPATPLVGRDDDRAALVRLVRAGARVVTLVGPGGVGKTRLAAAVAEDLAADHPDGTVVLPLASMTSAAAVVPAVARAVGVAGGDGPAVLDAVTAHLAPLRVLLVLDNMEQLLAAGPDVARLVTGAPGLTVLVTSRAPLRVRDEQEYAVEPLALPRGTVADEHDLASSPAGRLALQRARAVSPRLVVGAEEAGALAELCHRLAGLPLAIELVSAHLRLLAPRQLLDRLDELAATDGGTAARDLPARQRTVRATLDWSYSLLTPEQQRLFRLLGVFRGGATLEAVEAVAGGDVLPLLGHLVEQSVVVVRPGPDGQARYGQLEPVAQYARSRLVGDEAATACRRHAAYYCDLAEEAALGFERRDQVRWLARTEAEEANILLAVDRSLADEELAAGGAERAARTVYAMWLFWWLRGQVVLGRRRSEACLRPEVLAALPRHLQGRARLAAATMCYAAGDGEAAAAYWEQALALGAELDDAELDMKALAGTGLAALAAGDLATAEQRFDASAARGPDPQGRTWMESLTLIWRGTCLILRGEHAAALASIEQGLALARERGDRLATYIGLYNLSQAALAAGDLPGARRHLRDGMELSLQTGDLSNLGYLLESLAVVESAEGRPQRVALLLGAAQVLRESEGANVYAYYQPDEGLRAAAETAAREALGDDRFDDELDRGRGLEPDDVVALVLSSPAARS